VLITLDFAFLVSVVNKLQGDFRLDKAGRIRGRDDED